jgi:hypothetical protein
MLSAATVAVLLHSGAYDALESGAFYASSLDESDPRESVLWHRV